MTIASDAYDYPDAYDFPTDYDSAISVADAPQASGIPSKKRTFTLREKLPDTDWRKIEEERSQGFKRSIESALKRHEESQAQEAEAAAPILTAEGVAALEQETPLSLRELYEIELLLLSQYC